MDINGCWIADYSRYYKISKDDYKLYETSPEAFCEKYNKEIGQKNNCFTEIFIGSAALRDYDGCNRFQDCYPTYNKNPFSGYGYYNGILYAKIEWEIGTIYVPPVQVIDIGNGEFDFPLRNQCVLQKDSSEKLICYRLDL